MVWLDVVVWVLIWVVTALLANWAVVLVFMSVGLLLISLGSANQIGTVLRIISLVCLGAGICLAIAWRYQLRRRDSPLKALFRRRRNKYKNAKGDDGCIG